MLHHLPYQFVPLSPFWPHGPPEALPNFSLTKSGTCPLKQPASRPGRKLCPIFPRNSWTLPFVSQNRQGRPEALPDFSEPFLYLDDEISRSPTKDRRICGDPPTSAKLGFERSSNGDPNTILPRDKVKRRSSNGTEILQRIDISN